MKPTHGTLPVADDRIAQYLQIGNWTVLRDRNLLRSPSQEVAITPLEMDLLLRLVKEPGRVITKADLLHDVWNGAVVVERVLPKTMSSLRRALGDRAGAPRYIETIPKRGYRLLAQPRARTPLRRRATSPPALEPFAAALATGLLCLASCIPAGEVPAVPLPATATLRVALFNVKELSATKLGADASEADAEQVRAAIAIVRRINPDILVLQEIDQGSDDDPASVARLFADRLRSDPQHASSPALDYPFVFSAPSNTGRLTGIDLSGDGLIATEANRGSREHGDDSYGFGTYPGQYAMAVLSRTPFDLEATRTFQRFLWKDLPGHHIDTGLDQPFLSAEARDLFRLSSKSHWDLAVKTTADPEAPVIRLLVSHPTPPVFDGPEDRNGRRNFDEVLFWAHYLNNAPELTDDQGLSGGYSAASKESASQGVGFIVAGDLNAFPQAAADSVYDNRTAISQLLDHPLVQDSGPWLISVGAVVHSGEGAGAPLFREQATAGFGGGRRIDYLMPSVGLEIRAGGVFWPNPGEDPRGAELVAAASDHRLVWLDLAVPGS